LIITNNANLKYLTCWDNDLQTIYLTQNSKLERLQCTNNNFIRLDISHNSNLRYIEIGGCNNLNEMCVWELPFPPSGVTLSASGIDLSTINFVDCLSDINMNEVPRNDELNIYPNPSTGLFKIDYQNVLSIEITNSAGKLVLSCSEPDYFDLSGFSKGVYFVKALNAEGINIKSIVLY